MPAARPDLTMQLRYRCPFILEDESQDQASATRDCNEMVEEKAIGSCCDPTETI